MRVPALILVLGLALSGCSTPGPEPVADLEKHRLEPGTHLVEHSGGPFWMAAGAEAGSDASEAASIRVDLFDPGDEPSGTILLDPDAHRVLDLRPGTWALRVQGGPLWVSAAAPVRAAAVHVERHVIAEQEGDGLPVLPGLGEPYSAEFPLALHRAPIAMRLLATGEHEGLEVVLSGPAGPVLESNGGMFLLALGAYAVQADFHPENVRSRTLQVRVDAVHLHGAIVLESWSYSRAPTPLRLDPEATSVPSGYLYGDVTQRPVWFEVHPHATQLHLAGQGEATHVALWGPDDLRLGTFTVPANGTVTVPVQGGRHIAVAWGTVSLGSDAVPADLDLHPLETRSVLVSGWGGNDPPQTDGGYAQHERTVGAEGILYDLLLVRGGGRVDCAPADLRVVQNGEVLAATSEGVSATLSTGALLHDGPVQVLADGAEPCQSGGYEARSFLLPPP